jgi:hypothetical protein
MKPRVFKRYGSQLDSACTGAHLLDLVVHDADAQQQLLAVVVVEDARQVILEVLVDALGDVRHQQLLIHRSVAAQVEFCESKSLKTGFSLYRLKG